MKQNDKAHLTAISRNKTSAPMRWLSQNGKLDSVSKLDYGCGRGFDATQFGMDKYDPYYFDTLPKSSQYETITCNYVLNVIQSPKELYDCIKTIQSLLTQNGTAYITVRRDIKTAGFSKRGTFQRPVILNVRSIKKTSSYEIYEVTKNETVWTNLMSDSN